MQENWEKLTGITSGEGIGSIEGRRRTNPSIRRCKTVGSGIRCHGQRMATLAQAELSQVQGSERQEVSW